MTVPPTTSDLRAMRWDPGHNVAHAREIGHEHVAIIEAPGDDGVDLLIYWPDTDLDHHHHELRWWDPCECLDNRITYV